MPFNLREGDFDAIIFDCDGTLVDTAPTHFIAYREAFGSMGISVNWDWYESLLGLTPESLLDRYESEFGLKKKIWSRFAVVYILCRHNCAEEI